MFNLPIWFWYLSSCDCLTDLTDLTDAGFFITVKYLKFVDIFVLQSFSFRRLDKFLDSKRLMFMCQYEQGSRPSKWCINVTFGQFSVSQGNLWKVMESISVAKNSPRKFQGKCVKNSPSSSSFSKFFKHGSPHVADNGDHCTRHKTEFNGRWLEFDQPYHEREPVGYRTAVGVFFFLFTVVGVCAGHSSKMSVNLEIGRFHDV